METIIQKIDRHRDNHTKKTDIEIETVVQKIDKYGENYSENK